MVDLIISMKILKKYYKLKAFDDNSPILRKLKYPLQVDVSIEIIEKIIYLSYSISGDISSIIIPSISDIPQRKDDLWKTTCFELFLANKTKRNYIELNLSPSLNYNIYSFSDYRADMNLENSFIIRNTSVKHEKTKFNIKFMLESINIINTDDLLINISTVIKYSNDKSKYYAVMHNKDKADFHKKNTFVVFS